MKYKILQLDANGRISFTKEELEELLDEVYNSGYEDGRKTCQWPYYWSPTWTNKPNIVQTDKTIPSDYYKIYVGDYPSETTAVPSSTCTTTSTSTSTNVDIKPHWTAQRTVYGTNNTSTDKKYTG